MRGFINQASTLVATQTDLLGLAFGGCQNYGWLGYLEYQGLHHPNTDNTCDHLHCGLRVWGLHSKPFFTSPTPANLKVVFGAWSSKKGYWAAPKKREPASFRVS